MAIREFDNVKLTELVNDFANIKASSYDEYLIIYKACVVYAETVAKEIAQIKKEIVESLYFEICCERMEEGEKTDLIEEMQILEEILQKMEISNIFPYKSRITKEWRSCFNKQ